MIQKVAEDLQVIDVTYTEKWLNPPKVKLLIHKSCKLQNNDFLWDCWMGHAGLPFISLTFSFIGV